jgi:hypothetical protein
VIPWMRAGLPAMRPRPEGDFGGVALRFLVAVDVEGFSRRPAAEQARVQHVLERTMTQAALAAGLDRKRWYRQPRGDGELAILPAGIDGLSLVADYPRRVAAVLGTVNRGQAGTRLRVRMAIHHGAVTPGCFFGPVGSGPIVVSRLVDAPGLRRQLIQQGQLDIALIVSATVYQEVIQTRLGNLRPEAFRRIIVRTKDVSYVGYLCNDYDLERRRPQPPPPRQPLSA